MKEIPQFMVKHIRNLSSEPFKEGLTAEGSRVNGCNLAATSNEAK